MNMSDKNKNEGPKVEYPPRPMFIKDQQLTVVKRKAIPTYEVCKLCNIYGGSDLITYKSRAKKEGKLYINKVEYDCPACGGRGKIEGDDYTTVYEICECKYRVNRVMIEYKSYPSPAHWVVYYDTDYRLNPSEFTERLFIEKFKDGYAYRADDDLYAFGDENEARSFCDIQRSSANKNDKDEDDE